MRLAILFLAAVLAAACVHKIDVEQGNFITTDMVEKLKPGMSKAQVKLILGTPLLNDVFHQDRWDYYFDNARAGKHLANKKLTVVFRDEKLESVTGDANPPLPAPKRLEPAPAASAPPAPAASAPPVPAPAPEAK